MRNSLEKIHLLFIALPRVISQKPELKDLIRSSLRGTEIYPYFVILLLNLLEK